MTILLLHMNNYSITGAITSYRKCILGVPTNSSNSSSKHVQLQWVIKNPLSLTRENQVINLNNLTKTQTSLDIGSWIQPTR